MKNLDQLLAGNARLEAAKEARVTDDEIRALGLIGRHGGQRSCPIPGSALDIAFKRLLERDWVYVLTGVVFASGPPTYKPTSEGLRECEKRLPRIKQLEDEKIRADAKRVKAAHDADPIKDGYGYHRQIYTMDIRIGGRVLLKDFPFAGRKGTIIKPQKYAFHTEQVEVQFDGVALIVGVNPMKMELLSDLDVAPGIVEREPAQPMRAEFAQLFAEAPV